MDANGHWLTKLPQLAEDPDFVALHREVVGAIGRCFGEVETLVAAADLARRVQASLTAEDPIYQTQWAFCGALHTAPGRVNVKARTHEKVDSVGEGRAVECHVVLNLERC